MHKGTQAPSIFDDLDDFVVRLSSTFHILSANVAFCQFVGKSAEEVAGQLLPTLLKPVTSSLPDDFLQTSPPPSTYHEIVMAHRWFAWSIKQGTNSETPDVLLAVAKDISRYKERESELKQESIRYQQLIEHQSLGMFTSQFGGQGLFLRANSAAASLFGFPSVDAMLNTSALDLYQTPQQRAQLLTRLLDEEKITAIHLPGLKADGTPSVASLSLQLITDDHGEPVEIDGTIEDITELQKNERSLLVSQFIFDRAAVGIYRIDSSGHILDVNDKAGQMLGYDKDELCTMDLWDIDTELIPENWPEVWQKATHEKQAVFERIHRKKDGALMAVEINANLIEYAGKQFTIAFATDITERKRTEQELQHRQNLQELAQRIAKLGHWETSLKKKETSWSEEVYRIFEFEQDLHEHLYEKAWEHMHPEDKNFVQEQTAQAVATGNELDLIHRIILPGNRIKYLHVKAHCEYGEDTDENTGNKIPQKLVGTVQDITERQEAAIEREQTEQKLLQVQKLEAVGTLAGGIAHDFNNILTSIIGFTQLSMTQLPEDNPLQRNLDQVLKAGIRARELVSHILAFSRQDKQVFEPVQLRILVKEVLKLLRASIPATIEIRQNIDGTCCTVLGVPVQFHQIIVNLCTNAHHAIGTTNGRIDIALQEVEVGTSDFDNNTDLKPGKYAKLTVSDTGHGMDGTTMEKIFDPYFSTKRKEEGAGLGLSVVHGIVKKHGGHITASSEPGKGTTFFVYLPCTNGQKTDSIYATGRNVPGGSEHIVIVDDEKSITEMLIKLLGNLGYKVTPFTDPEDAVDFFRSPRENVDLVITDMTMPRMDGALLAKSIREFAPHIPIVVQTGFSEIADEKKLQHVGINAIIKKPILELELAHCIRKVLDGESGRDL